MIAPGHASDTSRAGLDGCMLDLLGTAPLLPGYATGIPIDARTQEAWRAKDWLAATSAIARTVQRLVRPAIVIGNGLGTVRGSSMPSPRHPSSSTASEGGSRRVAPIRAGGARAYPTAAAWLLDFEMLSSAGRDGKTVLVVTKAWAPGTRHQKDRLHEYALASFLLGMEGTPSSTSRTRLDPIRSARIPGGIRTSAGRSSPTRSSTGSIDDGSLVASFWSTQSEGPSTVSARGGFRRWMGGASRDRPPIRRTLRSSGADSSSARIQRVTGQAPRPASDGA